MNTKNLLVSILAIASVLVLVSSISAAELVDDMTIKVDGTYSSSYYFNGTEYVLDLFTPVGVVAGTQVAVEVYFTAVANDTDVTVEVELEGQKVDTSAISSSFDVEEGVRYRKTVLVNVPFELKDQLSDDLTMTITVDGIDYRSEVEDVSLRVQRPSYDPVLKSIVVPQTVNAGQSFPVDIVLKNMGYNDLDDVYVTATISALGVQKMAYFGDLANLQDCSDDDNCDEDDTVSGRLYLDVPYSVAPGTYSVEVTVTNDDVTMKKNSQVVITNSVTQNVIVSTTKQTVDSGEDAVYSLLLVNPTNTVQIYRIVSDSANGLFTGLSESVVAVPAGSSQSVRITASADSAGTYNFNVNVFSDDGKLVSTNVLTLEARDGQTSFGDPVVILTVVLAIIFIVLLIVLIVLVGKKPKKSEEFGESYY